MALFAINENVFEDSVVDFSKSIVGKHYSIPAFQRNYIWKNKPKKIIDLLESINGGFNLGTIVFWNSDCGISREKYNLSPTTNTEDMLTYVVDGQQRTLTLVSLFSSHNVAELDLDKIFICLSPDSHKLYFTNTKPSSNIISMNFSNFQNQVLFKVVGTYKYQQEYQKKNFKDSNYISEFENTIALFVDTLKFKKIIIGYKLGLEPSALTLVVKQFEKINASGIRLTQFDILDAMAFADEEYKLADQYSQFPIFRGIKTTTSFTANAQKIIINSYKLIQNFISSNESKYSLNANAISDFKDDDSKILEHILTLFKLCIDELKKLNLQTLKDVPYTHNIVAYIFIKYLLTKLGFSFKDFQDSKFLYSIMLQTGVLQSYEKSASQKLVKQIKTIVKQLETNQPVNLIKLENHFKIHSINIFDTSYKSMKSLEKALLIYWINKLKPQDYVTKDFVKLTEVFKKSKEFDHIFPKNSYGKKKFYNSFGNIALVKANTNKDKNSTIPSKYFSSIKHANEYNMYHSQFITIDVYNFLVNNQAKKFVEKRAEEMSRELEKHCKNLVTKDHDN